MKWKLAIGTLFLSGALCNQGFAVEFLGHAIQGVGSKQIDPCGPCCSGPMLVASPAAVRTTTVPRNGHVFAGRAYTQNTTNAHHQYPPVH